MNILKNKNNKDPFLQDPLGMEETPPVQTREPAAPRREKDPRRSTSRCRHRVGNSKVMRIEDLRQALQEQGENVDTDAVVSMYLPRRRLHRLAATVRRMNKLHFCLLALLAILILTFFISFTQEKMGNFTINLNRIEMYRRGISLADSGDFENPSAHLSADPIQNATNISINDLPENLNEIDGDHSGRNYLAYTCYLRNAGKEDISYSAAVRVLHKSKGVEKAVRVAVWQNDKRILYAMPAADGKNEVGCVNFQDEDTVCVYENESFRVGDVDKYTVVIWLEGDDAECVDDIVGGSVQFGMSIDSNDEEDDQSLFMKFLEDIKDMITGNKPIMGSSDNDVPEYYLNNEITWENRRNQ